MTSCFIYKVIRDYKSIDHLCINPIRRIGLIHTWSIDSCWRKFSVQFNVLRNKCKQNITSLSLLIGTTVQMHQFILVFIGRTVFVGFYHEVAQYNKATPVTT